MTTRWTFLKASLGVAAGAAIPGAMAGVGGGEGFWFLIGVEFVLLGG